MMSRPSSQFASELFAISSHRSLWLAVLLLVAGTVGSVMLYHDLQAAEASSLERHVSNLASYLENDLLSDLRDQINAQQRMAARLAMSPADDGATWQLNAELFRHHYPFYRLLAVVDTESRMRWFSSDQEDDLHAGQRFMIDDDYLPFMNDAAANGKLVITRPFFLPDRRPAVTFMTPIGVGSEHRGFLVAVMAVPEAIDAMIPALFREEMRLRAVTRDREVYPYPPLDRPGTVFEWDAGFVLDLDGDGEGFLFEFALNEASLAQLTTALPRVVLASGILLSFLLAIIAFLGMNALGQARVLAGSNRRLENEVRERQQAEHELEFLVNHDALTGLPNRFGISEYLQELIGQHEKSDMQLALLFLDLDQFKDINDSLGHHLGDQLLCEVPRRLTGVLRDNDFVGRHGGDEFLIAVVRDNREQVEQLAANILRAMDGGFVVEDHRLFVSASMGIAFYPESGRTVSDLIQNVDTALFKAKHAGRNQFAVFTREMFAQAQHRLNLSRDIRHALDSGEFQVLYQPIVSLKDLSLVGVEALLRWQHEKGYMVPPQEFIRIAEDAGIIGRLGQFALDRALSDLSRWTRIGCSPPWLAVNISGAQIHETGFAEQLSVLLHQHRIAPELLHLEITEEVLIENLMRNRHMLQKLDEIGMRIVVDDFGIGYSSLAYLKNFPISVVKIDRSFIRDLSTDPEDQAITRTICSLASDLGMQTVAEGVESAGQVKLLRSYRCTYAQGFRFSRPVDSSAIEAMLRGTGARQDSGEKTR